MVDNGGYWWIWVEDFGVIRIGFELVLGRQGSEDRPQETDLQKERRVRTRPKKQFSLGLGLPLCLGRSGGVDLELRMVKVGFGALVARTQTSGERFAKRKARPTHAPETKKFPGISLVSRQKRWRGVGAADC